jgi:predicted DNA repair protein MutK
MAGTSLLLLIDDIASVLDDVALMAKLAAKKTTGVLGDDLALNAQQVSGVQADRELPVVWAVAKGSLKNKCILVPVALAVSAFVPWAVTPLLMAGGAFLCFEGVEKFAHQPDHNASHKPAETPAETPSEALSDPAQDIAAYEKGKVQGAIRTDFILSAEIIAITLGTVAAAPFLQQVTVLSGIALLMTVGVYGVVAGIVRLDDGGLYLSRRLGDGIAPKMQRALGRGILSAAPYLMKTLSVVGTVAMFMVGGGILTHGMPAADVVIRHVAHGVGELPIVGGLLAAVTPTLVDVLVGVAAGALVLAGVTLFKRLRKPGAAVH